MKKLFIIMIVVAGAMTSCEKSTSGTCDCTSQVNGATINEKINMNKKSECDNYEYSQGQNLQPSGGTIDCNYY